MAASVVAPATSKVGALTPPSVVIVAERLATLPPSAVASSGLLGKSQYAISVLIGAIKVGEVETSRK
ncbi:MAG: hypothetical protein R2829_12485 [Bacteroidia bacterium]